MACWNRRVYYTINAQLGGGVMMDELYANNRIALLRSPLDIFSALKY
jgi:hypothetical protein